MPMIVHRPGISNSSKLSDKFSLFSDVTLKEVAFLYVYICGLMRDLFRIKLNIIGSFATVKTQIALKHWAS